jgi:hypothetical protein
MTTTNRRRVGGALIAGALALAVAEPFVTGRGPLAPPREQNVIEIGPMRFTVSATLLLQAERLLLLVPAGIAAGAGVGLAIWPSRKASL